MAAVLPKGVISDARDAARRAEALFDLREAYRERSRGEGGGANPLAAVEHLFGRPVTDIRELEAGSLDVSFEAARSPVGRLEGEGVLEEITGRRRNRVYAVREIVRVLQGSLGEE